MPPPLNRAARGCTVRRPAPAKPDAALVERPPGAPGTAVILLRILAPPSARTASFSSRIFLPFSIVRVHVLRRFCA